METKKIIKRIVKYIFKGIPIVDVSVNLSTINRGECLKGKKILITGGGRGLGLAMAKKCIEEGAEIIITGRNEDTLRNAVKELGYKSDHYLVFDMENTSAIPSKIDEIFEKYGTIDCLISNAGISMHENDINHVTIEGFEKQFRINLEGSYFLAQQFIQKKICNCNILFLSSERGIQCDDIPYGLTKAAINSLTRGLSKRFYQKGIRVNAIAPGITTSDMTGRKADENLYAEGIASGRFFIPEEVAEVAVFLLSDASKCISGEIINCDAGNYISSYY